MIQVFKRLIGNYKTIEITCAYSKNDILELTKYPDGDTLISIRDKDNITDNEPCVMVRQEDLEKLLEELK